MALFNNENNAAKITGEVGLDKKNEQNGIGNQQINAPVSGGIVMNGNTNIDAIELLKMKKQGIEERRQRELHECGLDKDDAMSSTGFAIKRRKEINAKYDAELKALGL